MPKVLGLDLASTTGACVLERGRKPICMQWKAPSEPDGVYTKRYAALFSWLDDMHAVHGFDAIGFECPWMSPHDKMNTLRILTGFPVIVECWAGLNGLPVREVGAKHAKKSLTGDSYAKKTDMIRAARELGVDVHGSDDEADSFAVAMVTMADLWPTKAAP